MKLIKTNIAMGFLVMLFTLLLHGLCIAAPESVPPAKNHLFKALVIGVSSYADKNIKAFSGSGSDAQKIGKVLTDVYGFQVKTLLNEKATRNEIINALAQMADFSQESSVMIIFLGSGEKDQLYDYTYWIPHDAKSGDVLTYIDNRQIAKQIKKIKSRHLLMISGASYPTVGISGATQNQEEFSKKFQGQSRWALISGLNSDIADVADPSTGSFGKAIFQSLKKNQTPVLSAQNFYKGVQSSISAKSGVKPVFGVFDSGQVSGGEFLFAKPEAQAALMAGETPVSAIAGEGTGNDAVLNITSPVQGADIYLNGIPWGKTPLKDKKVIAGKYSVKVSKEGYDPVQSEVVIGVGETKDVVMDILPSKLSEGTLKVSVTPQNAVVTFIDGKTKYSPGMSLTPGKYQIEVSKFGHESQKIDLDVTPGAKIEKNINLKEASTIQNSLGMKFVKIIPGSFVMGSGADVQNRGVDEISHPVKITKSFFMQGTEVTVGQWAEFVKSSAYKTDSESSGNGPWIWIGHKWEQDPSYNWKNPGFQQTQDSPVVCVSWNDANKFIAWLNSKGEGTYRLPTEAEWEYAARAGSKDNFSTGQCLSPQQANFDSTALWGKCETGKSVKMTVKTANFPANAWGLFDMHGNAMEWCSDLYGEYQTLGEALDPKGAKTGTNRVARGGAWDSYIYQCRSSKRFSFVPEESYSNLGFRLVAE